MKRLLISLTMFAASGAAFANGKPDSEPGFVVKTKLTYVTERGRVESARELVIPLSNPGWTPMTATSEGVVLMGQVVKSDARTIHMEYMLMDTRHAASVIAQPALIARLGQEAKVSIGAANTQVSISLLARRTAP